ncbi:RidA family protein [Roseiarcaceae bacterium H3SJ34-1]|uniref:RidA family protein n=1 Tax=Terripilifer ovatus TaxID=3032367 RepID=UPI003AB9A73C|nr:RidA family protein [Roseiarcaceae bacterium H3SJ34-1]
MAREFETGVVEARLTQLQLVLPPVPKPGGHYAPAVLTGNLLYVSGAIGTVYEDGRWNLPLVGKLGSELTIEQGRLSARYCVLNHLAAIKASLGTLDRVRQVVKLTGYVNAAPGFTKAPLVLDGASELLTSVFGAEIGLHARTAVYQNEMSFNAPIETDLIVEVAPA